MSKDLASLPHWFNEETVVDALMTQRLLSQDELEVLVEFYSTYQYRGDGYKEAFINLREYKCKIRYFNVEGEYVYEQPEVM